jgi:hypothetical protein
MAEQLVAAAHGKDGGARCDRRLQRLALRLHEVAGDQRLVAVLAAAHVEEVVRLGVDRLSRPGGRKLEADAAPLAAALEHRDVAAVGIDVHVVGIQPHDAQGGAVAHESSGRAATTATLPTCSSVGGMMRRS